MPDEDLSTFFRFFNEIGILEQLSRALLQARLPEGIHASQFTVLNHLVRVQDGRTPMDLARAFQVAKTTMTHTLSGLETGGYIKMRPNQEDARSKQVWITDKGRALRSSAIQAVEPDISALKVEFSRARVSKLLPELEALREIMDRRRNED